MKAKPPDTHNDVGPFCQASRIPLCIGILAFVASAYFYNGMGWNQIARYNAIFSFVEPGTPDTLSFRINRFLPDPQMGGNTGDWARREAHDPNSYYANKSPGLMIFGLPPYAALFFGERLLGFDPTTPQWTVFNCYALNLLLVVLPTAIATAVFFLLAKRLGCRARWALILTAAFYFGTMMFPFSTQLWGHTTAAAFNLLMANLPAWRRQRHWVLWPTAAVPLVYLALNASFIDWHGCDTAGPRYLIAGLPFMVLLGVIPANAWTGHRAKAFRLAVIIALAISASNMFVCAAIGPLAPEYRPDRAAVWKNPLREYYRMLLVEGEVQYFGKDRLRLTQAARHFDADLRTVNWGQFLGLPRVWSLLPWFLMVGGGAAWIWRRTIKDPATSGRFH